MRRRQLLQGVGAASAYPLASGSPMDQTLFQEHDDCTLPDCIHPTLGYTGFSLDELDDLPDDLSPDHEVELTITPREADDDGSDTDQIPEFFFEPTGLAIESGDVVQFTLASPDHTITAYHPDFGRQRRVPGDVPPFSSPVLGGGAFWLYRFEESGVYDLLCAPHEIFGMAMRIVVDEATEEFEEESGPDRRELALTAALVLADDALAPESIVESGSIGWNELDDESKRLLVEFRDPEEEEDQEDPDEPKGEGDVEIADHELIVEESAIGDEVYVAATFENTGDAPTGAVEATVDWYDDDGNYLANDTTFLQSLDAGEQWAARVGFLGTGTEEVADYEISGEYDSEPPEMDPEGLVVRDTEMDVGTDEVVIRGDVANERGTEVSYVEAIGKLYDSDGVVLGDVWTNVTDLPAEETWSFRLTWLGRDRVKQAADHDVWITDGPF